MELVVPFVTYFHNTVTNNMSDHVCVAHITYNFHFTKFNCCNFYKCTFILSLRQKVTVFEKLNLNKF